MKKLLLLVLVICMMISGCASKQTITSSFFIPDFANKNFENEVNDIAIEKNTVVDTSEFLYSDLCYEVDDVFMNIDYEFGGEALACFNSTDTEIIFSRNMYQKVYPASTTKLLTAYTALKYSDPDTLVVIDEDNCGITTPGAQLCGFKKGDKLTIDQLLHCLMIYSGNDAGVAIAKSICGSEEKFVELMNAEASKIGCINTHFANAHGLHNVNHYTTAYDMYLIFNECLKNKTLKDIIKCTSYTAVFHDIAGNEKTLEMQATNLYYAGQKTPPEGVYILGGKTGVTATAGYCLVIASENENGKLFITEVFKSKSYDNLYADMNRLLELIRGK